jgi:hypothetical protein
MSAGRVVAVGKCVKHTWHIDCTYAGEESHGRICIRKHLLSTLVAVPHTGRFPTEDEAATAYDRAVRLLLGPAGHVNFNEDADSCAAMHTAILLSQALGPGATPAAVQALASGQGVPPDVAASVLAAQKPRRQLDARTILSSQRRHHLLWVQQRRQELSQGRQAQLEPQSRPQVQLLPQPKERPPGQALPQLQKSAQQLWRRQRQPKQNLRQDGAEQHMQQKLVKQQVATHPRIDAWAVSPCLQHPGASSIAPAAPALDLESRQEPLQAPHNLRAATTVAVLPLTQSVHADTATSRTAASSTVTRHIVAGRGGTIRVASVGGTPCPPHSRGDDTDKLLDAMMQEAATLWEAPERHGKPRNGVRAAQPIDRDAVYTLPNPYAAAAAAMRPSASPLLMLDSMESSAVSQPDLHSTHANELLATGRCRLEATQWPSTADASSVLVAPADCARPLSTTAAAVSTAMARLEELLMHCPEGVLAALQILPTGSPRVVGGPSTCQIHTAAVSAVQALVGRQAAGLALRLP